MASNRLPVGHISGKQASKSYTCSEKYEWHNLNFHQSKQVAREQPRHVATLKHPLDMSSRMGKCTASHGQGHSSEIRGPGNGVDGPSHLSSSYGGCHGQDNACLCHSSKWARRSISPGAGPINSCWRKRSPDFDHVCHYAKGPDRQICQAVSSRKKFSVNQGTSCRKRYYREDRFLPTKVDFPKGLFSEKDAAMHRSYMHSFHAYNKHNDHCWEDPISNNSDSTSHGQSRQRHEVVRGHTKRSIQDEQLELSPNEDFHECLKSTRKSGYAYNGNGVKMKRLKQGFHKNTSNGSSFCVTYGRNSSLKRNADHLDGKEARINVADEDKSKRLHYPDEQDHQPQLELVRMRNDVVDGNAEIINLEGSNGAKWNCNQKKDALTVPTSNGLIKCDENSNMLSPKCSSKTIASLNVPNLSEGSKSMELESDKESSVDGCPKRVMLQHLPATQSKKTVQPKGTCNLSYAKVRRDCLELWRARRLRKDSASEADKILKADQQHTAQRSKVSTDGRVRNGRPAAFANSESNDEDDSASESSDRFGSATSSEGLQKRREERANEQLKWASSRPSICKCNKSSRNTTVEKGLMCSVNDGEIALHNEQEKFLCRQLSTDAKAQTSPNGWSGTSKVDHAVVSHPDNGVPQSVSHQEANNDHLNEGEKDKLGVRSQNKKETDSSGAKLAEKITSLCTVPTLLDQNKFASCSKHDNLKVNASEPPNHGSGTTAFNGSKLDRGAVNICPKRPVRSCESYYRDYKNWLYGSGSTGIQPETMNCNILKKKQEYSALPVCANEISQKATYFLAPQTQGIEISSYEQICQHCTLDTANSGASNRDDRIPCSSIPDLNNLPFMDADEVLDPSEEPVCQVATDGPKPQCVAKSLSDSLSGPAIKEEQLKQTEPNQVITEVCEKGTSESANQLQISDSNAEPPQLSTVEESSTSVDAFKIALCEFIKNILKPLCEDGLLTREVHKIIVKKAVEKVAGVWGSSAPSTEVAICRVLSDESQNLEKLVQGYLELYVGRGVLEKYA